MRRVALGLVLAGTIRSSLPALAAEPPQWTAQVGGTVYDAALSPDGRLAATADSDGVIVVWDASSGARVGSFKAPQGVRALAFSRDGGRLVSCGYGSVILWSVPARKPIVVDRKAFFCECVEFLRGDRLVTCEHDTAKVRDSATLLVVSRLKGMERGRAFGYVRAAPSPDGTSIALGRSDGFIDLWAPDGRLLASWQGHEGTNVSGLMASPDGKLLVSSGYYDGRIRLWELATGRKRFEWLEATKHGKSKAAVDSVAFLPDPGRVVSCGEGLHLWTVGSDLHADLGGQAFCSRASVSQDGKLLSQAGNTLKFWDISGGLRAGREALKRAREAERAGDLVEAYAGYSVAAEHGDGDADARKNRINPKLSLEQLSAALKRAEALTSAGREEPARKSESGSRPMPEMGYVEPVAAAFNPRSADPSPGSGPSSSKFPADQGGDGAEDHLERNLTVGLVIVLAAFVGFMSWKRSVGRREALNAWAAAEGAGTGGLSASKDPLNAFRLRSPAELSAAANRPDECRSIAREYVRAGKSQDFLKVPPEGDEVFFRLGYGRAFLRAGDYQTAYELLRNVPDLPSPERPVFKALRQVLSLRRPGGTLGGPSTYIERLSLASAFSKLGLHREAMGMLDASVVQAAMKDEADSMVVAEYFKKADAVSEFLDQAGEGRPPEFYSSYAQGFHTLGCPEAAMALLKRKLALDHDDYLLLVDLHRRLGSLGGVDPIGVPAEHRVLLAEGLIEEGMAEPALKVLESVPRMLWKPREFGAALRAHVQLGRPKEAGLVFADIKKTLRLEAAPELYYYYALSCEKAGRFEAAKGIYGQLLARLGEYKDASVRLGNLELVPAEEAGRVTSIFASSAASRVSGAGADKAAFIKSLEERERAGLIGDRFFLLKPLGVGGMGVVYKARDLNTARDVALKRLRGELASDPRAREGFIEEAKTLASLSHPSILVLLDVLDVGGTTYIVSEYIDGENLSELIAAKGRLDPRECLRIVGCVCGALAHAHARGVVHRDIKPGNIMLDRKGLVKVMDFGLARRRGVQAAGLVEIGAGTPAYMAPEQHRGAATAQSDLFALGVSVYEMLSGNLPFRARAREGLEDLKVEESYPPLPGEVPAKLAGLVCQCLRADPAARPSSAADLERDLAAIEAGRPKQP